MFAAAGVILFADSPGHLLTAPAYQAIASLHRSDKTQGNKFYQHSSTEPSFAKIGELQHAEFAHSMQAKEHKQCRAAGGA